MNNWNNNWTKHAEEFRQYCFLAKQNLITALKNPLFTQENVLNDILAVTKNAEFSKQHGLARVTNIKSLQKQVPIRNYDQLLPWINQEAKNKGGVLSDSQLIRWLKTSGSSGNSKKIPYTKHWMEKYRVPALGVLWATYLEQAPDMLAHPFATLDTQTIREHIKENINGIPYQGITNRNPIINEHDWNPPWYNAPWFSPNVPDGYDNRMYCRLRYFIGEDLRAITAINPSTLVALQYHLLNNLDSLTRDICDGTLFGRKIFKPDPVLANKLNKISTDTSIPLTALWPNLSLLACWTSASAKLYQNQLNTIFPNVKIFPFMTCGTEGIVTLPIDNHETTGPLAINQGIYEFLPEDVDINECCERDALVETLQFHELELGKSYHLIMTQANGLYRLAVGDIYTVVDIYNSVPRIEFSRRYGTFFSFTGEKITESQMLNAVHDVINKHKNSAGLFICCPIWHEIPYYKILIEMNDSYHSKKNEHEFASAVDRKLCEINEEYCSKRISNRLGTINVSFINHGDIGKYLEKQKSLSNPTQFKYKPLQTDTKMCDEILKKDEVLSNCVVI